jgi:ADP-L-glycero-D-manno-heptose 6-epimerase
MSHSIKGRVLVTGGAGFIGSALVWALNRRGVDDIVVTDQLGTSEKWRNLRALRFRDYVEGDDFLTRIRAEPAAYGSFAAVFHLGANSSTTERDASHLVHANYEYTKHLCEWTLAQGARFVYASSAATYGDGAVGMRDDDSASYLQTLRPLNMYGYSKHMFDLWALRSGHLSRIVGLKYFNVFGPNESHKGEMRSLVAKAYDQIRTAGVVKLFKSYRDDCRDGEQQRDFVYVKDAVEATLHFVTGNPTVGGLFNVGTGRAHTWIELVNAIFAALGRPPRIEFVEMPESMREKYQYFTRADVTKLHAAGFLQPATPLWDAVKDYVQEYLIPERWLSVT